MDEKIIRGSAFLLLSRPQDTDAGSVQEQECLFNINNSRLRISRQSKIKGCETPKALSSLIMVEESAAMKIKKQKLSPRQEENRTGLLKIPT